MSDIPPGIEFIHVSGDQVRADNVKVRGGVIIEDRISGNNWDTGESITVYPLRDKVQVTWNNGDDSALLSQKEANLSSVSNSYEISQSGGVTVTDSLQNGGVESDSGDISIEEDVDVYGQVSASGEVDVTEGSTIYGGVESDNESVDFGEGTTAYGKITSPEDIEFDGDSTIRGVVEGRENESGDVEIELGEGSDMNGNIIGEGNDADIQIGESTEIDGKITSEGELQLDSGVTVTNGVESNGSLEIDDETNIKGGIRHLDDESGVEINEDSEITGDIIANASDDGVKYLGVEPRGFAV